MDHELTLRDMGAQPRDHGRAGGLRRLVGDVLMGSSGRVVRLVVAVGMLSGLVAAVFLAALTVLVGLIGPERWGGLTQVLILGGAGAVIGLLILLLGNPGDVELLVGNIHLSGGRDDIRDLRSLVPVSLIGIAAGSAIGPEAPLVQTTGSIGSWLALRLRLDEGELRQLTIAGMAAGFTVLLGAPVGSSIFALEILHRRGLEYYEALVPALLGAITGYAVFAAITGLGLEPYLILPPPHRLEVIDFGVGLTAGFAGAAVAVLFTYLVATFRAGMRRLPAGVRPIVGGVLLGLLGVATPFALTFGEEQINEIVATEFGVAVMLGAAAAKLAGSALITTAGWRGGFIIPLFFVGACLGTVAAELLGVDRTVAMTCLMAAAVVGVTKTPLGSTLVVSEIAGLAVLPPVLLASLTALILTSRVNLIHSQQSREGEFAPASVGAQAGTGVALLQLGEHRHEHDQTPGLP
ncbi:MAG TPA: chloride channel protein [Euzebya sp.]|nr:chloride channel protein [Euzebya sp.]